MKRIVFGVLASLALLPVNAQLFSRDSVSGAAVGGLIGGIVGHNSGRRTAEGIGIGAGAGLLLGALADNSRREYYATAPVPMVAGPVYSYYPTRPNYALTGVAVGGLAGGIIGHNNGRKTAEGIAIGAGAGLVLGTVAEQDARRRPVHVVPTPVYVPVQVQSAPPTMSAPVIPQPPAPAPQNVPIIDNSSVRRPSPMSSANSLFGR